jgi:Leucine-rich repeat (LRR) protein
MRAHLLCVLLLAGGSAQAADGETGPRTAWGREEFAHLPADTAWLVVKMGVARPADARLQDEDLASLKRLECLKILDLRSAGGCCQPNGSYGGSRWDLRLTDAGLAHIAALHTLEELYLPHAPDISDRGLDLLARSLPRLRHLSLPFLGRVGPAREIRLSALPAFPDLTSLDLRGSQGAGETRWPGYVAAMARLEVLDASWCRWLRGGRLAALAGMTSLRKLTFCGAEDGDLDPLSKFAGLRELDLSSSPKLTSSGLAPLSGLKDLVALDLNHCRRVAALSFLSGLGSLARLDLADCRGLDSLAPLAGLGALRSLRLDNILGLGDAELAHLSGLGILEELTLCGCPNVTDEGLVHLLPLKRLEALDLSGGLAQAPCRITDRGLAHLGGLQGLRRLNLSGVYWIMLTCRPEADVFNVPRPFTDRGLYALLALKDLEELNLFYSTSITQAGAVAIARLPRLRSLNLGLCPRMEEGTVRYLAKQHPDLAILQPRRSSPGRSGDIW